MKQYRLLMLKLKKMLFLFDEPVQPLDVKIQIKLGICV